MKRNNLLALLLMVVIVISLVLPAARADLGDVELPITRQVGPFILTLTDYSFPSQTRFTAIGTVESTMPFVTRVLSLYAILWVQGNSLGLATLTNGYSIQIESAYITVLLEPHVSTPVVAEGYFVSSIGDTANAIQKAGNATLEVKVTYCVSSLYWRIWDDGPAICVGPFPYDYMQTFTVAELQALLGT